MSNRIGLLLPRSTDYPAMGYEIMEGIKAYFLQQGREVPKFFTENIGFGEDHSLNHARAEKLLLQDDVEIIIAYANSFNGEQLYPLATAFGKPFIILDAGMQLPQSPPSDHCYHLSLQGIHACHYSGYMAGSGNRKVLMATSFYDGGYRGPLFYDRGLSEAGGSICGNFVSSYRLAEFTIDSYMGLLNKSEATSVAACFCSYLAELFFKALHEKNGEATQLPIYCSPFMAEEELLAKCDFPGGEFFTVVPWASSLENDAQQTFLKSIEKKNANIFHLLGWEAAIAGLQAIENGVQSLKKFSYESPRGTVNIDPETHYTYAPLYKGSIVANETGKCVLRINEVISVNAEQHQKIMANKTGAVISGWKNNYLCI